MGLIYARNEEGALVPVAGGGSGGSPTSSDAVLHTEQNLTEEQKEQARSNIDAMSVYGGDMQGTINMNGKKLKGLNTPTEVDEAAPKGYVDLRAYPVGSIYLSAESTSPASLFGGTWEQLKNRFLLGAGGSYSAGATGGEAKHTLTVDEMPTHTHTLTDPAVSPNTTGTGAGTPGFVFNTDGYDWGPRPIGYEGSSSPHNNMPPYLAVYMWKRVA